LERPSNNPNGGPQETNRTSTSAYIHQEAVRVGVDLPPGISARLASKVVEQARVEKKKEEHMQDVLDRIKEKNITRYRSVTCLGRKYEVDDVDLKTGTVSLMNPKNYDQKSNKAISVFSPVFDEVPEPKEDLKPENLSLDPKDHEE